MQSPEDCLGDLDVSRETIAKLSEYVALIEKWNPKVNLVSKGSLHDIWSRHVADSAQVLSYAPPLSGRWLDLGSGGGFPGMVVAILLRELRSEAKVTLVEADQRKASFLRAVARDLGLSIDVKAQRIEALSPQSVEVVSARALAPLPRLLEYVKAHLGEGGSALLLKGKNADEELQTALETWRFDCETYPSKTNSEAVILKIGEIERV